MKTENPREIAVRVLRRRAEGTDYTERLLEKELSANPLKPVDRALCQELVYGVVRWQTTLDWLVARKTGDRPQAPVLRLLLHLGLYQLFWLQRIPNHAAVNETVELCRRFELEYQSGFLNAVLRGYTRAREDTVFQLESLKQSDPPVGYSHPEWLVKKWQNHWGVATAGQLMQWNNTPPGTYARLNSLKTDYAGLTEAWAEELVEFSQQRWDWTGREPVFELKAHPTIAKLGSFQKGYFYVQDPSTLLAVMELDPQPGETVLDLCAAPGGKTGFIGQRMENRGRIIAYDNVPERLRAVTENCERLGITCVEFSKPEDAAPYDRILVDAPCSNTGVTRRRVDLRWRITKEEIERLRGTQQMLLGQVAPLLKPGGILVYSTCSLEPEENEGVVRDFLGSHPEFKLERERQLMPFAEGVDGAYVARLIKSS